MSRVNDRDLILFSINSGPMRALTHNQRIDFQLTCFLKGFGGSTSATANSPSPCLAVSFNECCSYFASTGPREFSGLLGQHRGLDPALPADANGNSLESCECGDWREAKLLREQDVIPEGRMPIERQV